MSPSTEDRLRAALQAKAAGVTPAALDPARHPLDANAPADVIPFRKRIRWVPPLLAAAAVIGVAVATAAIVSTPSAHHITPAGPTNSVAPTPLVSDTVAPTETKAPQPSRTPATTVTASKPPTNGAGAVNCYFIDFHCPVPSNYVYYQSLWPFPDYARAQAWQVASKSGGAQPWHLDAGQTALLFTQNYLGFADITMVTTSATDDQGAHVGVGYRLPNGEPHTAAVLHLVRFTPNVDDSSAGWEVVGSDDTDFALEQPAYGSRVTSPMTAGGHITGVDENIVVDVKDLSGSVLTGTAPGVPAGGQNSAWHATVSFHGSGVLTIVAFTGGHLIQHERFAIQGVHT